MHGRKKQIFYNDTRFYPDHDFPLELLKKRNEYTEAKKVRGGRERERKTNQVSGTVFARMGIVFTKMALRHSRMLQRQRKIWLNKGFQLRW